VGQPKAWICFLFFLLNLFLIKKINITKFKVRKHDFTLNLEIKLFYTIFIREGVCWAGPAKSGRVVPSLAGLARSPDTAWSGPQVDTAR
jgi:hypothetical protein